MPSNGDVRASEGLGASKAHAPRAESADARAILEALARIERRLDRVEALAELASRDAKGALAGAVDTFDDVMRAAAVRGIDVDARARDALRLVERATEPEVVASLERLLELAKEAPGAVAMAADTFDGVMGRLQSAGIDLDQRAKNVLDAAERLSSERAVALLEASLARADAIRTVLESGVLDPAAVAIVSKAGRALADAAADPGPPVGALGLMRAVGDADIRAASGLLVRFARRLGRAIAPSAAPALPAAHPEGDHHDQGDER